MAGAAATPSSGAHTDAPPCAEFARAERIDPAGSAGYHPHIVVVEVPLPWPRDIAEHPQVAPHAKALSSAGVRVQAVVSRLEGSPGARRLAHYWLPAGPFHRYGLTEHTVADEELGEALAELARQAERTEPGERGTQASHSVDVLVCSHGRRDQCCGTLGTRLVADLQLNGSNSRDGRGDPPNAPTPTGVPRIQVLRTSHTGGHRFAPTALLLPEGTAWAFLDSSRLEGIVDRTLDVEAATGLYRGCTGLDDPAIQVCDREAFRTVGWSWLEHRRAAHVLERSGDRTAIRLEHTAPTGEQGAFEAVVEVARTLPVPECRRPLDESRKTAPEYRVVALSSE